MDYEYIDTPAQLSPLVTRLREQVSLAVDTEAAGYHRYLDKISLLQVSLQPSDPAEVVARDNFLIDPLALPDLSALTPVFEDPGIEKIFHDADYDLRIMDRDLSTRVRGLFDTQIAAAFVGERSLGLGAIIERYLEIRLPKAYQRADWAERPLIEGMKEYAATDTAYLHALRDRLRAELEKRGRLHWAEEEFRRREETRWAESQDTGDAFMRIKGARDLPPRGLAILRELNAWRESVARERDQAPFRILSNQVLLELSARPPRTPQALRSVSGVSDGLIRHRGAAILDAVRLGLELPDAELPRFPPPRRWDRDPELEARIEALREARNRAAEQLDLDPGFLISRTLLEEVAKRQPAALDELREIPDIRNWQAEAIGRPLLAALR
jgi:ribonuclease D